MTRREIYTDKPVDRKYQYSPAIVHHRSGLVFVSGVCGWDENGVILHADDPAAQARLAFENLRDILAAAGCRCADVIWSTEYVTDIRQYPAIARVRAEFFPDNFPTATLVEVSKLFKPGQLFEIQTIAGAGQETDQGAAGAATGSEPGGVRSRSAAARTARTIDS